MKRIRIFSLLAVLALSPASLVAQDQDAQSRIDEVLARAEQEGLPMDLLYSKIREGEAKNVAMEKIAEALARRADGLAKAREAMQSGGVEEPNEAELAVASAALENGVSGAVLKALMEDGNLGPDARVAATAALGYLASIMPDNEALQKVSEALEGGADALANLPAEAARARGLPIPVGFGPSGIPAGVPAGVPAPGELPGVNRPGVPGGLPGGGS